MRSLVPTKTREAGIDGPVKKLGFAPGKQTGQYSRHFDSVVATGRDPDNVYKLPLPLTRRFDAMRDITHVETIPPHEHLVKTANSLGIPAVRGALSTMQLPRAYLRHPVVVGASPGELVWPTAIYMDGVQYARENSSLGFWIVDLIHNKHHLVAAVQKSTMCCCGCRGWCTLWPLLRLLNWSFEALAMGVRPAARHDGTAFALPLEASKAGQPFGFKAANIFIKGDWAEFAGTLAFVTWSSATCPCPKCTCDRAGLYVTRGLSALGAASPARTTDGYELACASCEIIVEPVPHALWRRVRGLLFYDTRQKGVFGRALAAAIPEHGLLKHDRLEPCPECPDIGDGFDRVAPARMVFWRTSAQTVTRHRNPIFNRATGITPSTMMFDYLHVCCLGVFPTFLGYLVWQLILANVWDVQPLPMDTRLKLSTRRLQTELFAWYGEQQRLGRTPCRVQALTAGMLGDKDSPYLRLHAAECNWFLDFADALLTRHGARVPAGTLAGMRTTLTALAHVKDVQQLHRSVIPDALIQGFVDAIRRAVDGFATLGVHQIPKLHALMHFATDVVHFGSPAAWACWEDESLNQVLKAVSASAHRLVWHKRVLENANLTLARRARRDP